MVKLSTLLLGILAGSFLIATFSVAFGAPVPTTTSDANIIVSAVPQSSIIRSLIERVATSWPWYVIRASGLAAAIMLVVLMLSGIGFITGHAFSFLEPIVAWATHRVLGIALGLSVLLHVTALYFDNFIPFGIKDLLIPFASRYRPVEIFGISVGSLYVALGVLALYTIAAIVLTSLLWIDKKPKVWKLTHFLSYLAAIFVFIHALYLGTDLAGGLLRWLWIGLALVIVLGGLARLRRSKTI